MVMTELAEAPLPFVMVLRWHRGTWARTAAPHKILDPKAGPWPARPAR